MVSPRLLGVLILTANSVGSMDFVSHEIFLATATDGYSELISKAATPRCNPFVSSYSGL